MTQSAPDSAAPGRARRTGWTVFWVVLALWVLVLGTIAVATWSFRQIYTSDRILPGVRALGIDLGGLSAADAAARLASAWKARTITLTTADTSWTLPPDRLGVKLDADATVHLAHAQGRSPATPEAAIDTVRRLLAALDLLPIGTDLIDVQPAWRFDRDAAAETLRVLANQIDVVPLNAGIQVVDGQVRPTPPVTGRSLEIATLLAALETRPWQALMSEPAASPGRQIAAPVAVHVPAITDVSATVAALSPLLTNSITVQLYDPIADERSAWEVSPADMGRWLVFETATQPAGEGAGGSTSLAWSVDEEKVAAYVGERNSSFGDERYVDPKDAVPALSDAFRGARPEVRLRVYHGPRQHVVRPGETLSSIAFDYGMPYPWIQAANPDLGDTLLAGATIVIPSPDLLLPLPVVEDKRIAVSLKEQRVKAYENGRLKWDWSASTGLPDSPTSPGVFQVRTHEPMAYAAIWNLYMPWFMGIYQPVPGQEFMNGFHGFPSRDRKQIIWQRNLGRPITYGCILIDSANARQLYDWAEAGVVVEITP